LAIVLGTGFQYALSRLAVNARAPYKQLPGFPRLSVSGLRGELLIGKLGGTAVLAAAPTITKAT